MTILPKSTLAGQEGVEGAMLLAESKNNAYFFDYTTKVPGQPTVCMSTFATGTGLFSIKYSLVSCGFI